MMVIWGLIMNNLFVYVEGYDDKLFVEKILSRFLLNEKSLCIHTIPYAQKSNVLINKDIKSKRNHVYLFLSDLDSNETPCILSKKEARISKYSNLDFNNIIIVKEEIESWFLAGIDSSIDQFKNFNIPDSTDLITKEEFNNILKDHSIDNRIAFLIEVSRHYNIKLAAKRNSSFKYFLDKITEL